MPSVLVIDSATVLSMIELNFPHMRIYLKVSAFSVRMAFAILRNPSPVGKYCETDVQIARGGYCY